MSTQKQGTETTVSVETFDVNKSINAQKELCEKNNYPHFAPLNGFCYDCRQQIYKQIDHGNGYKSGISYEKASRELITGCPHCHYSYCE